MKDVILSKEAKKEISEVDKILKAANILVVKDNKTYSAAGEFLKRIKGKIKALVDRRKEITLPLDESKKSIMDLYRDPLDVLKDLERKIKSSLIMWDNKQEEIRRAEEDRLAKLQQKEADRLAKRAEKAAEKGQDEKAEDLKEQAQQAEAFTPIVPDNKPAISGISKKVIWKARIVGFRTLVETVAKKEAPLTLLTVDQKELNAFAKMSKGEIRLPGVEIYSEDIISSGRI